MELSPPPGLGGASASAIAVVAGGEANKRARKRSRYLSPPYTDTVDPAVQVGDGGEELPLDLCTADVLSGLRAAALLNPVPNAAKALCFLILYRRKRLANPMLGHLNLHTATGSAHAVHTPPAPASKNKKHQKQNPQCQQPPAIIKKENAAAATLDHKRASNAAGTSAPHKRRRRKNKSTGQENPVALVLDFARGTPLPSRDDLLSTFCRFGSVIHSETATLKDRHSAQVVFATRAQAEAAYSCTETLDTFGPPFATPRLQDHPPIALNAPPPLPKLPLKDVRKNLEKMISSLSCSSSFKAALPEEANKPAMGNLVGEMQGLLAKVDKMLQRSASSSAVHHR